MKHSRDITNRISPLRVSTCDCHICYTCVVFVCIHVMWWVCVMCAISEIYICACVTFYLLSVGAPFECCITPPLQQPASPGPGSAIWLPTPPQPSPLPLRARVCPAESAVCSRCPPERQHRGADPLHQDVSWPRNLGDRFSQKEYSSADEGCGASYRLFGC